MDVSRPPMLEQHADPENATPLGRTARYAIELERRAEALCDALGSAIHPNLVSDVKQDRHIRDAGIELRALLNQVPKEPR